MKYTIIGGIILIIIVLVSAYIINNDDDEVIFECPFWGFCFPDDGLVCREISEYNVCCDHQDHDCLYDLRIMEKVEI